MLVLSRKKNESVVINNDIRVVVVEIRGDKVRLGVEAPKELPVHRSEVYEAITRGGVELPSPFAGGDPGATSEAVSEGHLSAESRQISSESIRPAESDALRE